MFSGVKPMIDREVFKTAIYAVGPATNESQEEVHDVLDWRWHAHVAAHPEAGGYVGLEIGSPLPPTLDPIDDYDDVVIYHYFDTNYARLLAAHLIAAAAKADSYRRQAVTGEERPAPSSTWSARVN